MIQNDTASTRLGRHDSERPLADDALSDDETGGAEGDLVPVALLGLGAIAAASAVSVVGLMAYLILAG